MSFLFTEMMNTELQMLSRKAAASADDDFGIFDLGVGGAPGRTSSWLLVRTRSCASVVAARGAGARDVD